jgi:hypothetical protein
VTNIALLDVGITTLIPFLLITIINLLIAYKLKKTSKLRTSATSSSRNWEEMTIISNQNSNHQNSSHPITRKHFNLKIRNRRIRRYSEATKTLMLISFVFLLLHCPLAVNKCWYFINSDFIMANNNATESINENQQTFTIKQTSKNTTNENQKFELREYEEIFERITCYIFYLNFSLNFFLYTFNKSKFRCIIIKQLKCKWLKEKSNKREIYA